MTEPARRAAERVAPPDAPGASPNSSDRTRRAAERVVLVSSSASPKPAITTAPLHGTSTPSSSRRAAARVACPRVRELPSAPIIPPSTPPRASAPPAPTRTAAARRRTAAATCPTCSGMGKVRAQQGFFTVERTCPTCGGRGQIIKNPCVACGGAGRVACDRTLNVNIPAGVETGTRIRLAGEGEAGRRGGPAGDLYIFIEVERHPIFERENQDLYCRIPISMTAAALP